MEPRQTPSGVYSALSCYKARSGLVAATLRRWVVLQHRFWSAVSGADIPLNCQIGGGLLLPHPNGVVIHPAAVIGPNCLIFQQVTLGTRGNTGAPVLAGHVDVGAGAKLLGALIWRTCPCWGECGGVDRCASARVGGG